MDRPPTWALVGIGGLIVANGLLIAQLGFGAKLAPAAHETPSASAALDSAAEAPSSPSSAAPAEASVAPATPTIVVYGDGYSAGSALGGEGAAGWPAEVAAKVGGQLALHAVSMAGYGTPGVGGQTFADIALAQPPSKADVTVVFGSRNDMRAAPAAVQAGATAMYSAIRQASPATKLVVIGPAWSSAAVPAALLPIRDAVARAARAAGATFVDPIAQSWFSKADGLIGADGISPTDAGHAYLAAQISPVVQSVLTPH